MGLDSYGGVVLHPKLCKSLKHRISACLKVWRPMTLYIYNGIKLIYCLSIDLNNFNLDFIFWDIAVEVKNVSLLIDLFHPLLIIASRPISIVIRMSVNSPRILNHQLFFYCC